MFFFVFFGQVACTHAWFLLSYFPSMIIPHKARMQLRHEGIGVNSFILYFVNALLTEMEDEFT